MGCFGRMHAARLIIINLLFATFSIVTLGKKLGFLLFELALMTQSCRGCRRRHVVVEIADVIFSTSQILYILITNAGNVEEAGRGLRGIDAWLFG